MRRLKPIEEAHFDPIHDHCCYQLTLMFSTTQQATQARHRILKEQHGGDWPLDRALNVAGRGLDAWPPCWRDPPVEAPGGPSTSRAFCFVRPLGDVWLLSPGPRPSTPRWANLRVERLWGLYTGLWSGTVPAFPARSPCLRLMRAHNTKSSRQPARLRGRKYIFC